MTRPLTILSVAYALAPVGPDAVGGAEQVLSALDHALVARGHRSLIIACRGSVAAGTLIETGVDPSRPMDDTARAAAVSATRAALARALRGTQVDVVHMHGLDFSEMLQGGMPPTLVTLHLPPSWYPVLPDRPGVWLHGVSDSQHAACPQTPHLLPPIPNGVDVARLGAHRHARRDYALMLGRVCPEKGQHLALRAAQMAGVPLLIGGTVYPYPAHKTYFAGEVAPLLDRRARLLGPLGFARKRRLLAAARCLLVPSLAPETSSLVTMEAAACGTPVVAFPAGALADLVEEGRTGFLVDTVEAMADGVRKAPTIDAEICRRTARERFALGRMVEAYLDRYARLAGRRARAA